jgi:N-acetylglutamate synthase-like GNAT family acetyltransferase
MMIRGVTPDEYERAGRLVVASYQALPGEHLSGGYAEELAAVARRAIEAELLVAVDGDVVGCVTLVPDASSPWAEMLGEEESGLRMLAVAPAAQGRGVGGALLGACIDRARELGRRGLFLHSTPWMHAAHHLYDGAGFVRVPERDWTPVPDVSLWAFLLDLTQSSPG